MKNNSLHKGFFRGLATLILLLSLSVSAQSLTGTRGLIKAPTARMYESGTLAIGMGYVPAKFFKKTYGDYQGLRSGNPGLNTFITFNTLPFMEIMFRYSHEINMKVLPTQNYFPDRMFTVRFKLLDERKNLPAIVLGLQDITAITETTCKVCSNFTATYIVGSKIINHRNFTFDFSLGYATDLKKLPAKDFKGFFGGIEIEHKELDNIQILIEHDSTSFNIGLQGYLYNRLHAVIGLMDFKPMYVFAYRYKI